MMEYHRNCDVDIRIVRIFNTYGPNLNKNDGRVSAMRCYEIVYPMRYINICYDILVYLI